MLSCGVSPGLSRLFPSVVAHAPVQVLARSVHAGERLLVQQARQPELRRHPPHHLHRHHLMVGGDVGVLEDRRDLVLAGRHFVVAGLDRDADLVELALDFHHEGQDAVGDGAEVVVFHLLPLGRPRAEEGSSGVDEIRPVEIELPVDQEVLLLGTAGRDHAVGLRSEQLQDAHRLLGQAVHRAQQRRLLVERITGPAHERRRDDERRTVRRHQQPGRAGRVPRGVAARFERRAHAARREARGIRLALHQFLAAELGNSAAVRRRGEERVVLFRRDPGHRLEPVGVVRRAVLDRPVLQRAGDDVRNGRVEAFGVGDGAAKCTEDVLGQPGALDLLVERQRAEFVRGLALKPPTGRAVVALQSFMLRITSPEDPEAMCAVSFLSRKLRT